MRGARRRRAKSAAPCVISSVLRPPTHDTLLKTSVVWPKRVCEDNCAPLSIL